MKALVLCLGLLVSSCQTTDSFCSVYQRVVLERGDGTIAAPLNAKRRILANELTYKKLCQ